jgi:hypothetical protein
MNVPNIEKAIEEQLQKELLVIKENRKREPVSLMNLISWNVFVSYQISDSFLTKFSEHTGTQQSTGISTKGSFSMEPMCKILVDID